MKRMSWICVFMTLRWHMFSSPKGFKHVKKHLWLRRVRCSFFAVLAQLIATQSDPSVSSSAPVRTVRTRDIPLPHVQGTPCPRKRLHYTIKHGLYTSYDTVCKECVVEGTVGVSTI